MRACLGVGAVTPDSAPWHLVQLDQGLRAGRLAGRTRYRRAGEPELHGKQTYARRSGIHSRRDGFLHVLRDLWCILAGRVRKLYHSVGSDPLSSGNARESPGIFCRLLDLGQMNSGWPRIFRGQSVRRSSRPERESTSKSPSSLSPPPPPLRPPTAGRRNKQTSPPRRSQTSVSNLTAFGGTTSVPLPRSLRAFPSPLL